jgi:hypothetical protein
MLRRNMTSAECQISDPKGRYLVFTLLFFQMPLLKTQDLNTKIITKKPKNARNCESRANLLHCRAPFYPCFKQVDNLGAYSIPSRDRLFSSHLFATVIVRYAYSDP